MPTGHSIYGTLDVVLHLNRFHNIDLFSRGVYFVRVSVSADAPPDDIGVASGSASPTRSKRVHAIPYVTFSEPRSRGNFVGTRDIPSVQDPRLLDCSIQGRCFNSRMFVIRYRDEELELNEIVQFQFLTDALGWRRQLAVEQVLQLKIELMFAKLSCLGDLSPNRGKSASPGPNGSSNGEAVAPPPSQPEEGAATGELEFEQAASQTFLLDMRGCLGALHEYVPVTFDELHFAKLDAMCHIMLQNLKYRRTVYRSPVTPTPAAASAATDRRRRTTERSTAGGSGSGASNRRSKDRGGAGSPKNQKSTARTQSMIQRILSVAGGGSADDAVDDRGNDWANGRASGFAGAAPDKSSAARSSSGSGAPLPAILGSPLKECESPTWPPSPSLRITVPTSEQADSPSSTIAASPTAAEGSPLAAATTTNVYFALFRASAAYKRVVEAPGSPESRPARQKRAAYCFFVRPMVEALETHRLSLKWLRTILPPGVALLPSAMFLSCPPEPDVAASMRRVLAMLAPEEDLHSVHFPVLQSLYSDRSALSALGSTTAPYRASAAYGGLTSSSKGPATPEEPFDAGLTAFRQRSFAAAKEGTSEAPPPAAALSLERTEAVESHKGCSEKGSEMSEEEVQRAIARDLETDESAAAAVERDIHFLARQNYVTWQSFVALLPSAAEELTLDMRSRWLAQARQRWACQTFLHTIPADDFAPSPLPAAAAAAQSNGGAAPLDQFDPKAPAGGLSKRSNRAAADSPSSRATNASAAACGWGAVAYYQLGEELDRDGFNRSLKQSCQDAAAPMQMRAVDLTAFGLAQRMPMALLERYCGGPCARRGPNGLEPLLPVLERQQGGGGSGGVSSAVATAAANTAGAAGAAAAATATAAAAATEAVAGMVLSNGGGSSNSASLQGSPRRRNRRRVVPSVLHALEQSSSVTAFFGLLPSDAAAAAGGAGSGGGSGGVRVGHLASDARSGAPNLSPLERPLSLSDLDALEEASAAVTPEPSQASRGTSEPGSSDLGDAAAAEASTNGSGGGGGGNNIYAPLPGKRGRNAARRSARLAAAAPIPSAGVTTGPHCVVLHHGFHGSPNDLRLIRDYIRLLVPDALLLNAESNQRDPDAPIHEAGARLAAEVRHFILTRCPELADPALPGRLSFVGHSAGSLTIRAALTHRLLRPFLPRLHAMLSLSSPHLGTLYSGAVVSTGMWAMRKWRRSAMLEELMLADGGAEGTEGYLTWLSRQQGLEFFRYVVLVSAHKDSYVPMHSARIQMCEAATRDAEAGVGSGALVAKMVHNLLGPLDRSRVFRLNLYNYFGETSVDTMIGRAAHISVLDSPQLVQLLIFTLYDIIS